MWLNIVTGKQLPCLLKLCGWAIFENGTGRRGLQRLPETPRWLLLRNLCRAGHCYALFLEEKKNQLWFSGLPAWVINTCSNRIHRPETGQASRHPWIMRPFRPSLKPSPLAAHSAQGAGSTGQWGGQPALLSPTEESSRSSSTQIGECRAGTPDPPP